VSFQLKPSICSVDSKIRIPKSRPVPSEIILEADEDEWEPGKDSDVDDDDDYEVVYVTESESEDSDE